MDQEKIKIKINIAGESILLTVPFSAQDETRDTEQNVNSLFKAWRQRFPEKSDKELLAMIAFQYASHYDGLLREYNAACDYADRISSELELTLGENAE